MIRIQTGRRLHFGLFSPVPVVELDLAYGGLGVMLDTPGVIVTGSQQDYWQVQGNAHSKVVAYIQELKEKYPTLHPLHMNVQCIAPTHQGWGTGTQLAMAVARICLETSHLPWSPIDAAMAMRRGRRSGIGIEGFQRGGLLLDCGQTGQGRIVSSYPVPKEWTFVLIEPGAEQGLHAERELQAFDQLTNVDQSTVIKLQRMAHEIIIPSVDQGDFDSFAYHLTEYNRLAGAFFHDVQYGDYSTSVAEERLTKIAEYGASGRGQSSWGPGLFAVFPSQQRAEKFCQQCNLPGCNLIIAPVMKHGAQPELVND